MSAPSAKPLNTGQSSNKFRFASSTSQARAVKALDVAGKRRDRRLSPARSSLAAPLPAEHSLLSAATAAPPFAALLQSLLDSTSSPPLQRLASKLFPLTRSLAEALHHGPRIVALLLGAIAENDGPSSPPPALAPLTAFLGAHPAAAFEGYGERASPAWEHSRAGALELLAAAGAALSSEVLAPGETAFTAHLAPAVALLAAVLSNRALELPLAHQVSLLTCLGSLLRLSSRFFLAPAPSAPEPLDLLRASYGGTLGDRRPHVRRLAAQAFAAVFRALPAGKVTKSRFKGHYRRALAALEARLPPGTADIPDAHCKARPTFPPRALDILGGLSSLLSSVLVTSPTTSTFHSLHHLYYPPLLSDLLTSPTPAKAHVLSSLLLDLSRCASRKVAVLEYDDAKQKASFDANVLSPLLKALRAALADPVPPPPAGLAYALRLLQRLLGYHRGWGLTGRSLPAFLPLLSSPLLEKYEGQPEPLRRQVAAFLTAL
ncbi:hypothetical protein TeGR_g11070 [Tetraparma gracilis]|uniref:Uncharacterized protein n=1 Tax=Tetraparma gracilis TaxID=2962635 RepID=A0ABQ6MCA1_9STRA|nr:hypothetical protein TeGR_g11070 [Tetraparma gracilis]